jgi:hypothetical protein
MRQLEVDATQVSLWSGGWFFSPAPKARHRIAQGNALGRKAAQSLFFSLLFSANGAAYGALTALRRRGGKKKAAAAPDSQGVALS